MTPKQPASSSLLMSATAWFLAGISLVLVITIGVFTLRTAHDQKEQMISMLHDRGSMIVWALESAARVSRGPNYRASIPTQLFTEIARQPEVEYLAVVNRQGVIVAHNNPKMLGSVLYPPEEIALLKVDEEIQWRIIETSAAKRFEAYKYFTPPTMVRPPMMRHMGEGAGRMYRLQDAQQTPSPASAPQEQYMHGHNMHRMPMMEDQEKLIIIVGLNMEPFEHTLAAGHRNTFMTALLLGLAGFACMVILFLLQKYRISKKMLQDTQVLASKVITNLPLGLLTVNPEGRLVLYNDLIPPLFQMTGKQIHNMSLFEQPGTDWRELIQTIDQKKSTLVKDISFVTGYGASIPMTVYASKMSGESGATLGYLFMLRDLSEVKHLEEQVRRNERLSALGNMAAGVAHEIRNPLSSIKGFATYLAGKVPQNSDAQTMAHLLIQEVERLNRVVSELLAFARPSDLHLQPTNLAELTDHACRLVESDARARRVTVKNICDTSIPLVSLDRERFTQALLNLVLNAIQASDEGAQVLVETSLLPSSPQTKLPMVAIKVKDSGSGISEQDLKHIFTPYFTTKAEGTGLGLSITSNIIEKHNASISVESELGTGTTFTITLACTQETTEER